MFLKGPQVYRMVFHPLDLEDPAIKQALSDDLADIYCDVKEGLLRIDRNSQVILPSVVWNWKFGLASHWGKHAANAINVLHAMASKHWV